MAIPVPAKTPGNIDWFVEARFGLFIHWGIYSVAARHEWVKNREKIRDEDYQKYFDHFDPDLYDPREWARVAKRAGMKYFVITTKHHDGFCLFDSKLTDYKAPNTPAGRDLIKPMVEAFRAEGLGVGFYHSLIDWHHPEYPVDGLHPRREDEEFKKAHADRDIKKYAKYLHGQVKELLSNYGKIDVIWFDFSYSGADWGWSKGKGKDDWQAEKLIKMIRKLQPDILIDNRTEIFQDFITPEQYQPLEWVHHEGKPVFWEACQTLNGSWGYDRDNLNWKSPEMLVTMLVDGVAKGGNLLLNVGPTGRGEFDPRAVATLEAVGDWMHGNGRSIYGCTQSEFAAPPDCRFTQNGDRLYLHLFSWPMKGLYVPGLKGRIEFAQFLHDGSEIHVREGLTDHEKEQFPNVDGSDMVVVQLPIQKPDQLVPVVEIFLKQA